MPTFHAHFKKFEFFCKNRINNNSNISTSLPSSLINTTWVPLILSCTYQSHIPPLPPHNFELFVFSFL
jgi:hypothetical protein